MPSIVAKAATSNTNSEIQREEKNVQKAIEEVAKRNDLGSAKKLMYNVWRATVDLCISVIDKRIGLQQLRHKLNLHTVFNNQLACLDDWVSIERDHTNVLSWTIQDLQASTLRLPVTGGAKGDIETIKAAVCSTVDVIQVEGMNSKVSEFAEVAAQERAMLDECESLLAHTVAIQMRKML